MLPRFQEPHHKQTSRARRTTASRCTTRAHNLCHHASKPSCRLLRLPMMYHIGVASETRQPATIHCKPSFSTVSLLQAPCFDAVQHRTINYQTTPAAVVHCKQPKLTPMRRPLATSIILATATRATPNRPTTCTSRLAAPPAERNPRPMATLAMPQTEMSLCKTTPPRR